MAHTSKNLKKIYLNRINNLEYNSIKSRGIRKMAEMSWEEFDSVWVKYNNNEATYEQWEKALNKWLNLEAI